VYHGRSPLFRRNKKPPSWGFKSKASEKLSYAGRKNSACSLFLLVSHLYYFYEDLEVLTAMVMKSPSFWVTIPCSPLKINRCFRRICRLHLQGRRISQARHQHEADSKKTSAWNLILLVSSLDLILRSWWWRYIHPKRRFVFNGLRGDMSQKIGAYIQQAQARHTWPTASKISTSKGSSSRWQSTTHKEHQQQNYTGCIRGDLHSSLHIQKMEGKVKHLNL
jgi:hypothetical protein